MLKSQGAGSATVVVDIEATRSALERVVMSAITGTRRSARFGSAWNSTLANLPSALTKGWNPWMGDNDGQIDTLPDAIRASRDLYHRAPFARSALQTHVVNMVGRGLRLRSIVDHEIIGMTLKQAIEWQNGTERLWRLYANKPRWCDVRGVSTIADIQRRACLTDHMAGDSFALLPFVQDPTSPWSMRVQLIATERVSNPDHRGWDDRLIGGLENAGTGRIVAAHVRGAHPESTNIGMAGKQWQWQRVPFEGRTFGRPNIAWSSMADMAEMTRGRPLLETAFASIKGIDRYTQAEAVAAVVSSLFTMVIKNTGSNNPLTHGDAVAADDVAMLGIDTAAGEMGMGPGATLQLAPGEDVTSINPGRPNAGFDPFILALARQVGMATDIPVEILLKHFQSSYTAARGAYMALRKVTEMRTESFARRHCQPIYEAWLTESVARGMIKAPGFFSDPLIRAAYCGGLWIGPPATQIDPVKDTNAAIMAIDAKLRPRATVAMETWGEDWDDNVQQLAAEADQIEELGLGPVAVAPNDASNIQPSKPSEDVAEAGDGGDDAGDAKSDESKSDSEDASGGQSKSDAD